MGKSHNHKNENTFRFQTFSERIKNINIDVIHQIRHHDDTPEETGTYFAQALQKQTELNCTDHFNDFKKEVSLQVKTFTQLVHNEENIVAALKKHLLVPDSMALPAILDLLVQLARDLQADFYRHFREFFQILVQVLTTYHHNIEVLEATFSCLSYIFKFLWRYLLKDIEIVYGYFSALLSRQYKEYIRNFAAESFAFLMRKSKDPSAVFEFMFASLRDEPEKCNGVGRLMFEMIKGVKSQFHSCMVKAFPLLLKKLGAQGKQSSEALPWQHIEESLATTVLSMAFHADKEHLLETWNIFMTTISCTYTDWESCKRKDRREHIAESLARQLRLLNILLLFKRGSMISKPDDIAKVFIDILKGACLSESTGEELLTNAADLLVMAHSHMTVEVTARLTLCVFKTKYSAGLVYGFSRKLYELPLFEKDVLPSLLKYCQSCIKHQAQGQGSMKGQGKTVVESHIQDVGKQTLSAITDLILCKCPLPSTGEGLQHVDTYLLDFGPGSPENSFPTYVASLLETADKRTNSSSQSDIWAALVCLPHVRPLKQKDKVVDKIADLIRQLLKATQDDDMDNVSFLGYQAMVTMVMMLNNEQVYKHVPLQHITQAVITHGDNVHILRLVDVYLTHAVSEDVEDILTAATLLDIFPSLQDNLTSPYAVVRQLTLRILAHFDLPLPPSEVDHVSVFQICLSAENTAAGVQTYRERQRHLQNLDYTAVQNCLPSGPFTEVALRYLIGSLHVNFKLLWEPIRTLIASHAHNMNREAFWEVWSQHLQLASDKSEKQLLGTDGPGAPEGQLLPASDTNGEPSTLDTYHDMLGKMKLNTKVAPNYSNFRVQLWQTMQMFPEKCSPKSRIFVPLLFRFIQNEYYLADQSVAPTQNVLRKSQSPSGEEDMDTSEHNAKDSKDPRQLHSTTESKSSPQKAAKASKKRDNSSKTCRTGAANTKNVKTFSESQTTTSEDSENDSDANDGDDKSQTRRKSTRLLNSTRSKRSRATKDEDSTKGVKDHGETGGGRTITRRSQRKMSETSIQSATDMSAEEEDPTSGVGVRTRRRKVSEGTETETDATTVGTPKRSRRLSAGSQRKRGDSESSRSRSRSSHSRSRKDTDTSTQEVVSDMNEDDHEEGNVGKIIQGSGASKSDKIIQGSGVSKSGNVIQGSASSKSSGSNVKPRVRTRSMCKSESDQDSMDVDEASKGAIGSTRRRTRNSSKSETNHMEPGETESEMESDFNDDNVDNDDETSDDNDDDDGAGDSSRDRKSKKKRLSAIIEANEDVTKVDSMKRNKSDGGKGVKTGLGKGNLAKMDASYDAGAKAASGGHKGAADESKEGQDEEKQTSKREGQKKRKAATSSLLAQLELFAKFKDPLCMYRELDLRQLYFDLLIHKNSEVQTIAFQCIMTYKYKYLVPYRENFERLLDDKTFKNEIILFSIDHENSTISSDHRPDVLPILMRILFGKMHAKTGKNTTGKQHSGVRQSIVLRFLNGCHHNELKIFIDLVFAPFQQLVSDNPLKMVKCIKEKTDLTCVLPVKKMQGALNSIDVIFKKLAHHLDSFLPNVIQIIIGMATLCSQLLSNRDRLVPHVITPLKNIRQSTVYRITQIFTEYDKYAWRPVEIDAVFEGAVWSQLDKLSYEGLYHPTPLLKLLHCWSRNPRYVTLLGKHHREDVGYYALPHIIKLLLHKDVSSQVTSYIMEMLDNLLRDTDEDEMEEIIHVEVHEVITLPRAENVHDRELGIRLLLPHIGDLLIHIEKYVSTFSSQLQGKKKNATGKELNILSRLSKFVKDEEMSKTLIRLLLPYLGPRFNRPPKTEEDILTSVLNLLKQITDRSLFFCDISKLFATLSTNTSRARLAEIFAVVCEGHEDLEYLADIVQKFNSWDMVRVEEPDYMLRLEGYRLASSLVKAMVTMETRVCLTLIHNCCFFINTIEDMSLRDNSTQCIVNIIQRFGQLGYEDKAYNILIMSGLMMQLRSALRNSNQTVLHEYVSILAVLVDTFGNQSAFEDLKPLRDKDLDADFFENIKHIQIYKRSRALRRLIKYLDTNIVKKETVNAIFLPLVASFLSDDIYKKYSTVQDAAVDAVGVMCRLLPWKPYLNQLQHYLKLLPQKLDRQKLYVKVIVAVMDNFHFDLGNSTLNVKLTPIPKVEREPKEESKPPTVTVDMAALDDDDNEADTTTGNLDDDPDAVPEINEAVEEVQPVEELSKRRQLCTAIMATRIHEVILKNIMSKLHKVLVKKARSDDEHKLAKSSVPEDEEILRVPIALAMVKLLQNLPKGALERFLPGVLLKVCNFLKSRSPDIRNTARETLVKIQATLGPRFFPFILSELRGSLRRGYQRHVLCYTVYMLLKNMEEAVRPGDIDICLTSLQQVFNEEVFGEVSEEKDVDGIKSKVFEARSSKSYDSYEFIAKYISIRSLMKMMEPLKKILDTSRSQKSARKAQEVLRKVCSGLLDNRNITIETLLVFIHSMTAQTLPLLTEETRPIPVQTAPNKPGQKPQSCLLLVKAAPRGGLKPRTSKKTNKHVLVEFGLQLLGMCFKKQRVVATETMHIQMLDPLVPMLSECLASKYVLINANCLRVLCYMFKFPLPSLKEQVKRIANAMFVLLRKYATAGAARGDNMELVSMLFKAVTVLVRDVRYHKIEDKHLQVLLTFCEEDIHDYNRQSTAFSLLKAILFRKLNVPEIHELMKQIEEMSISSESAHVQRECRQAVIQYLLDYQLGKRLEEHLQFYVTQLSYELESGRESALEMLEAFFTAFPQSLLTEYSGLFFLPMGASMANDESARCRKLITLAIKSLLGKLEYNARSKLYSIVLKWFTNSKLKVRCLAAQLCGLFVEVEGGQFETRLAETLPAIEQQLEPGKYKQVESEALEHNQDLMIYKTMTSLMKILRECPHTITSTKYTPNMNLIWEYVDSYLNYPHIWVQLCSSQLFGLLFAVWQPEDLIVSETSSQYLTINTHKKLKSLSMDFINQMQSELLNEELALQVVKNLIFITKCAKLLDATNTHSTSVTDALVALATTEISGADDIEGAGPDSGLDGGPDSGPDGRKFSVLWLVRKMAREAHHEAIMNSKVTLKRMHVFKWLAAISVDIGAGMEQTVLRAMIPPLQRELNDQSNIQDPKLRALAGEVVELLKKTMGLEKFTEVYASTQKVRAERKDKRKQQKAFQAVANPEVAAKRKLKKNLAKIAAKKRKVEHLRPSKKTRKRKYKEFALPE